MALNYMRIGRRVQEIRKMRKLSQADLAELADMSVPYISHIETALKKPSLESVVKIADALGVTVDQLLNGNQSNDHHTYEAEVAELLADCNSKERRMIFELEYLLYKPNYHFDNHLFKYDTLFISYEKPIIPMTYDDSFDWFDGYDYVLDGNAMERFLDLVDQYSDCDTSSIRVEMEKKKAWYKERNGDK